MNITTAKALHYVNEQHEGYLAFVSDDGLVFRSEMVDTCKDVAATPEYARYRLLAGMIKPVLWTVEKMDDADRVIEDFTTFPIVDDLIDFRALRAHMGY